MSLSAENISKIRELVRSGYPLKARDAQDLLGHNDHLTALLEARFRLMLSVESERDQFQAAIATPESVFINLKAGKIPKPSLRSMIDLYGEVLNGEDAQLHEIAKLRVESEHLRGCEDVLRQLASYCGAGGYNAPEVDPEVFAKKIMDGINILNDPLAQLAEKRGAERDSLKTENEALRGLYQMHKATETREMRYLKTENEALRKDAERYRWLRGQHWNESEIAVVRHPKKAVKLGFDCPSEGRLDCAIDAAMGKGELS